MIKSIRLQNFFGFQDCTINLEKGENVLVGINGSGKSNFFKAIKFLKEAIEGKAIKTLIYNDWGAPNNVFFSGSIPELSFKKISFLITFDGEVINSFLKSAEIDLVEYLINITIVSLGTPSISEEIKVTTKKGAEIIVFSNKNGRTSQLIGMDLDTLHPPMSQIEVSDKGETAFSVSNQIPDILLPLRGYLRLINIYSFFDTSKNSELKKPVVPLDQLKLSEDGGNLTQLLNWLRQNQKRAFSKINEQLERVSSVYNRVDFLPLGTHIQLQLDEKHLNKPIAALNVSDGTLKFLCLMAILCNPNRGNVVCIDEPELGLHPDMISTLCEGIKHASETSQIIISTHSPELLNHFDVQNIRVFEKDENNATVVSQFETEQFDNFMNKYMPGQLWRQGHLGGNRW
jgi:predicted ATPase